VDEDKGTALAVRAWYAWRGRGAGYVAHKALRRWRPLGRLPGWKRRLVYADPRRYWTLRGGTDYFREQEDHPSRSLRAAWLADRVASYAPASVLEVGCGYGKQLGLLRDRLPGVPLVGVDFSPTQLGQARL
jgi:SAM-dependent methyltransferase